MEQHISLMKRPSHKHFIAMVIGQVISIMGASLLRFGLSLYILDSTGRADLFGILYALSNIPTLLSPIGGAIADRLPRKNLMVIFDFTSGIIVFFLLFFVQYGVFSILPIGIAMILLGLVSAFYQPAVQASIPSMVHHEKIEGANGLVNGVGALAQLAAPIMGGVLYGTLGITLFILCCGIAFIFSAIMEIFIEIPFVKRKRSASIIKTIVSDMKDGFVYIQKRTVVLKLVFMAALFNLIITPFFLVGTPIVLRTALGANDAQTGIGMGLLQLSTILGALFVGIAAKYITVKKLYIWLYGIAGAALLVVFSLSPYIMQTGFYLPYTLFLTGIILIAMLLMILCIYVLSAIQKNTPTEMLGKVMATITAVSQCVAPVGQFLYGVLFSLTSIAIIIPAIVLFILIVVQGFISKKLFKNEEELM